MFNRRPTERPDPADLDLQSGTVTRVAQQKKDPDRASVFIDDAFAFGLDVELVVKEGVRKGVHLSAEQQRALLAYQEVYAAKAAALGYVSDRARTTDEVRTMLLRRGFDADLAEDTVADVQRLGLLDDAAYAHAFARSRFDARGYGPARIRQDLMKRGVARGFIDDALAELPSDEVGDAAQEQAATKWRTLSAEEDLRKRKKKTMDFLVRRGFSYGDARDAVDALARDEEDIWE